jgi:hypothetical protein
MPTQQILTDLISKISIRREEHRVLVERMNALESIKTQIQLGKELQSVEFVIKFKDSYQLSHWNISDSKNMMNISDTKNMMGTVNQILSDEIEITQNKLIDWHITIQKELDEYARKWA